MLPTCDNLVKTRIVGEVLCSMCEGSEESAVLCLRDCPLARKVWLISPLIRSDISAAPTMNEWINVACCSLDKDDLGPFFILAWCLRNNRNDARFNHSKVQAQIIVGHTVSFWGGVKAASIDVKCKLKWRRPRQGWVMLHF